MIYYIIIYLLQNTICKSFLNYFVDPFLHQSKISSDRRLHNYAKDKLYQNSIIIYIYVIK